MKAYVTAATLVSGDSREERSELTNSREVFPNGTLHRQLVEIGIE